ncbi:PA2BC Phospholipase, partial [Crypturellus undulatus]|nr:PA2BC Phospholipase [Crypturellus undulatus]
QTQGPCTALVRLLTALTALPFPCPAAGTLPAGAKGPAVPPAFAPALEGSTVANASAPGCSAGWGARGISRAAAERCCLLLRSCCYARLAARRCPLPRTPRARAAACRSGSWCERGVCRCERQARLCRLRARLPGARRKCRAGGGC